MPVEEVVHRSYCNYSIGNAVFIKHANDSYSQYEHFSEIASGINDDVEVKRGDIIGYVGSTGESSTSHLHFSLSSDDGSSSISGGRKNNNPITQEQFDTGVDGVRYDQNVWLITDPYKPNGGTLGTDVKNFMINIGGTAKVRSDEPVRDGYKFDGWLCKVNNVTKGTFGVGAPITGLGTSTDVTLTAQWKLKTAIVTLDCDGGRCSKTTVQVDLGGTYSGLVDAVPLGDYDFAGWYYDGNEYKNGDPLAVQGAHTLTAKWQCGITYDLNGGSGTVTSDPVAVGAKAKISATIPTKDGYHFKGWINEATNKTVYPGAELTLNQNVILSAKWEEKVAVISYETGCEIDFEYSIIPYSSTENGQIPVPSINYPGGICCGEWTIKNGDGTVYNSAYGDYLPEFKSYVLVAHDLKRTTYPVTYNFDLGLTPPAGAEPIDNSDVLTSDEKEYGIPYYIQTAIPEQYMGHNFLYWQDSEGNKYAPGEKIEANKALDLTAQWVGGCFVIQPETGVYGDDPHPVSHMPLAMEYPVLRNQDGSLKADSGIRVTSDVPVRPGYRFSGWFCPYGSAPVYLPGRPFVLPDSVYSAFNAQETNVIPLIARWMPKYVTVNMQDPDDENDYLDSYTARVLDRYGNKYEGENAINYRFPIIDNRNYTAHIGWSNSGVEVTEDSIVTTESEHSLTPVWTSASPYSDVRPPFITDEEKLTAIAWCKYKGYMTGVSSGTFEPDSTLTRGQVAAMVHKCMGQPACGSNSFVDVSENDWYNEAVTWCDENGIMSGVGNGRFNPADPITRAQFATVIYRLCGLLAPEKQQISCTVSNDCSVCASYASGNCILNEFTDVNSGNTKANYGKALAWANDKGIMGGISAAKMSPDGTLTRWQCAIILRRFFTMLEE